MADYYKSIATYRTIALIYNPQARGVSRTGVNRIKSVARLLGSMGHDVNLLSTTGPRTAGEIARAAIQGGADLILVAGGDGTINETINGVAGLSTPVAVLPAGTANVLAREMALPRRLEDCARGLANLRPARISLGRLTCQGEAEGRYFLIMAGIGLDAHIVYNLNLGWKARLGKVAYWTAGFHQIWRRLPQFDVHLDGVSRRCGFALASRVRNYGGDFNIAPTAHLFDPDCELVLFQGEHAWEYVRYLAGAISGQLEGLNGVSVVRAHTVSFSSPDDPRIYVQLDGEYVGRLPATVEIIEDALTLLVPPSYRRRRRK